MLTRRALRISRLIAPILAVILAVSVIPAGEVASANSGATAIVTNAYYLNVRSGPGVGYGVVTVLGRGAYVTMLGRNANASWIKIQPIDGYYWQGWVNAFYLAPSMNIWDLPVVDGAPPPPPPPGAIGTVANAYSLNLRSGPGVGYGIITALTYGTQVTLIGRNAAATWLQVQTIVPQGLTLPSYQGWVNAYYITTTYPIYNLPVTDGSQPGPRIHVVQRGETMYRIARYYGTTVQAIAAANGIVNPNLIYVGQRLVIP